MNKKITAIITTATIALGSAGVAGIIKATEPQPQTINEVIMTEEEAKEIELPVQEIEEVEEVAVPAVAETYVKTPCSLMSEFGTTDIWTAFERLSEKAHNALFFSTKTFMDARGLPYDLEAFVHNPKVPAQLRNEVLSVYNYLAGLAEGC